jgi:methyl-accepting chemotaxis protein
MNAICLLVAGLLGVAAIYAKSRYDQMLDESETTGRALRLHTLADMHHDGAKGALYRVLYSSVIDPQRTENAIKDLEEQITSFKKRSEETRGLKLSANVLDELNRLASPIDAYVSAAREITVAAQQRDLFRANQLLPAFEEQFEALARLQDKAGDTIETDAKTRRAEQRAFEFYADIAKWTFVILLGSILAAVVVFMRQRILGPLNDLKHALGTLQNGDTRVPLVRTSRKDELGDVFRALELLQGHMDSRKVAVAQSEHEQKIREEASREIEAAITLFERGVDEVLTSINETSSVLDESAVVMREASSRATQKATAGTRSAEGMSAGVQTLAAAGEKLSESAMINLGQVKHAEEIARIASQQANETAARMLELHSAIGRIGDFVGMISGIAEKSSLLALNAAIEAARAGESGRGFGIVATEVKQLASATGDATAQIAAIVANIQSMTRTSADAIDGIQKTIGDLNGIAITIGDGMTQQQAATDQIARSAHSAAQDTSRVATNLADIENAARQAGSTADQVLSAGTTLSEKARHMRDQVTSFLDAVRTNKHSDLTRKAA